MHSINNADKHSSLSTVSKGFGRIISMCEISKCNNLWVWLPGHPTCVQTSRDYVSLGVCVLQR